MIFNELAVVNWHYYLDGQTIGKKGAEGGTIIEDFENLNGARITVEKECNGIPYVITLGIYSLMFHTRYEETKEAAITYLSEAKFNINNVFELYDVSEDTRNEYWQTKHHKLLDKIAK